MAPSTTWRTFGMTQSDPIHIEYFIKTTYVSVKISLLGSRTISLINTFFKKTKSINGNDLSNKGLCSFLKDMEKI